MLLHSLPYLFPVGGGHLEAVLVDVVIELEVEYEKDADGFTCASVLSDLKLRSTSSIDDAIEKEKRERSVVVQGLPESSAVKAKSETAPLSLIRQEQFSQRSKFNPPLHLSPPEHCHCKADDVEVDSEGIIDNEGDEKTEDLELLFVLLLTPSPLFASRPLLLPDCRCSMNPCDIARWLSK
ncbi:hypothetical protein PRIPAC_91839 [Pristionchus pacificus]|uniref:Uncharacterized protein n=1 Tax=Pristionchus pacificus TaxID=54126 RepID=A0A2A6CED5_PRIPA|nr:hypothetical protein PRIPAC_91839 [Pristionchus pacificus]|eukprot:PDM76448.1 hypothetical protein PRIPAC_40052 [Pristionchus pacificus]